MNTTAFHKTLLALIISGACASTLGAEVAVRGDSSSTTQSTVNIQNNQLATTGSSQNSAAVQVSVDESSVSGVKAQAEKNVQAAASLGRAVADESQTQLQSANGALSASVDSSFNSDSDTTVSTLDGITIDLSGDHAGAAAIEVDSTLDATLRQTAEAGARVTDAALGTALTVLESTAIAAEEAGSAADVSAAAQSSTDAATEFQMDDTAVGAMESTTDSRTSLTGGLL